MKYEILFIFLLCLVSVSAYIDSWTVPSENPNFFVDCLDINDNKCNSSHICTSELHYPNESVYLANLNHSYFSDGLFNVTVNSTIYTFNVSGTYRLFTTCNDTSGNNGSESNYFDISYLALSVPSGVSVSGGFVRVPEGQRYIEDFKDWFKTEFKKWIFYILLGLLVMLYLLNALFNRKKEKNKTIIKKYKQKDDHILPMDM